MDTMADNSGEGESKSVKYWISIYMELAKARLSLLVIVTTVVGFVVGTQGTLNWSALLWTVLGTSLAAVCANTMNQWLEVHRDGLMARTQNRPLPSGRIGSTHALVLGVVAGVAGTVVLATMVNAITAILGALNILLYVAFYTPLKVKSSFNTVVGAVCGAIPPMMGWTGATGSLGLGAWVLGAVLFVWQIPHFMALAWMYREDYQQGGFRMLPAEDPDGVLTGRVAVIYSIAMIPVALSASLLGLCGWVYAAGSLVLGLWMLLRSIDMARELNHANARRLFLVSIIYLPVLLILMVCDSGPARTSSVIHPDEFPDLRPVFIHEDLRKSQPGTQGEAAVGVESEAGSEAATAAEPETGAGPKTATEPESDSGAGSESDPEIGPGDVEPVESP